MKRSIYFKWLHLLVGFAHFLYNNLYFSHSELVEIWVYLMDLCGKEPVESIWKGWEYLGMSQVIATCWLDFQG